MDSERKFTKAMTLKERLYMPPLEKYLVYDKFPWKLVIHILLVILTTSQVVLMVIPNSQYSFNQYVIWIKLFCNLNAGQDDTDVSNSFNLFSIKDVNTFVNATVDNYYNINNKTVDNYYHNKDDDDTIKPIKMYVKYYDEDQTDDDYYKLYYPISQNDLGPFSWDFPISLKDFLDKVERFSFIFILKHRLNPKSEMPTDCYEWRLTQDFKYSSHGVINVSLETARFGCESNSSNIYLVNIMKKYIWLSLIVGILAGLSLIDCWRYLISRAMLVAKFKGHRSDVAQTWETLPLSQKLALINPWMIFITVGNIAQIFGFILAFTDSDNVLSDHDIILGISCFCSWIYILRYLPHNSNAYTVINTFRRSVGTLAPYIIGVLPIFLAYVFLGLACFWQSGFYVNTTDSMISAYSFMNGDTIYDVFYKVTRQYNILGMLYMYSFILFFICCVHNIFIAIIQEGFGSLKTKPPKASDDIDSDSDDSPGPFSISSKPGLSLKQYNKVKTRRMTKKAFRRILDGEDSSDGERSSYDPTKFYESQMADVMREIEQDLTALSALSDPPAGERVDKDALQGLLNDYINVELRETIDKLFHS